MKKTIYIITAIALFTILILSKNVYAASLDTIDVQLSKTTVRPGEEVTVTIQFGQDLGAYIFDVAYDNHIFEYVSAEGGTANDLTDKVRVVFHDSAGGTNPRTNMSVTFRAKADITTSNPTDFAITGEGLSNADASVTFDDITTPIEKNVTVEPEYVDYTLHLSSSGDMIKGEEKEMQLSYSSPMGRYYEHARLIAEATTPQNANVQLLATDEASLEHDIIDSGWGDSQGYKIGGKDVSQVLNVRTIFSDAGDYTITLKLIDRDNSDQTIAEQTFYFTVLETATITPPEENNPGEVTNPEEPTEEEEIKPIEEETSKEENQEEIPAQLPKTGRNKYVLAIGMIIILMATCIYINKRK